MQADVMSVRFLREPGVTSFLTARSGSSGQDCRRAFFSVLSERRVGNVVCK